MNTFYKQHKEDCSLPKKKHGCQSKKKLVSLLVPQMKWEDCGKTVSRLCFLTNPEGHISRFIEEHGHQSVDTGTNDLMLHICLNGVSWVSTQHGYHKAATLRMGKAR